MGAKRQARRWSGALGAVLVASGLGACSTTQQQAKVDDSRLLGVPAAQMTEVDQAKAGLAEAQKDLQTAERGVQEAESRIELAKSEAKTAEAEVDKAKAQAKAEAQKRGAPEKEAEQAPMVLEAQAAQKAADARVSYLEALHGVAKAQKGMADKQVELARAEVERAQYRTLARVNPQEAKALKLKAPEFEAQVAERQADVSKSRADLARSRGDAVDRYNEWIELEQARGSAGRRATAPPPTPSGAPTP